MKKLFTFFIALTTSLLMFGQGIIISDEIMIADFEEAVAERGYSIESSWGVNEAFVVENPYVTDANESDSVFMQNREAGSWNSASKIAWDDPVVVGERNYLRLKVYSEDLATFVYIKILDAEDNVLSETWGGMPAQSEGQWGTAVIGIETIDEFSKIEFYLSANWGGSDDAATAYVDNIEMYKESYEYQEAFNDMVYESNEVKDEEMDIDGLDLEDIWLDAEYAPIEKLNQGEGTGISAEWASVWDADYLYLFFNVTDDVVWKWDDADWAGWQGDGFQVYMDVLERRIDERVFGNLDGFYISPDLESDGAKDAGQYFQDQIPGIGSWKTEMKQASIITGTGYTIEVALPWEGLANGAGELDSLGVVEWVENDVVDGLEIAFDLQLNDNDGSGRANMMSWASEPKEPYGNSGTWGGLKLVAASTVGVVDNYVNSSVEVYSDFTTEMLNVKMKNLKQVNIYSLTGKQILSKPTLNDNMMIDISGFANGMYIISVSDGSTYETRKFIKK